MPLFISVAALGPVILVILHSLVILLSADVVFCRNYACLELSSFINLMHLHAANCAT